MKVIKAINNNIVSCEDTSGHEVIVMGCGLGYHAKPNTLLDEMQAEKVFRMSSQNEMDKLKNLFSSLPTEHIEVSSRIITYAKEVLGKRLNENVYITLTDHINFAITRFQQGMVFRNVLLSEVRTFYAREFSIGKYALELVEKELQIILPEDEAASIALHIANAEYDTSISEIMRITQSIQDIMGIIKSHEAIHLRENSSYYDEFIVHLKFLALRAFGAETEHTTEEAFVIMAQQNYPIEYSCAAQVSEYLEKQSNHEISVDQTAYLAVHIHRVNTKEKE